MFPRGEVAWCRSGILHRSRHSQYWRRLRVVPVCGVLNLSNSYSTGNPWSKRIDARGPWIRHLPSWWYDAAADIEEQTVRRLSWTNKFWKREWVFNGFPNLCCPERWYGVNRISHPDWVKLCVDPNGRIKLRAKQKYEILSATPCLCRNQTHHEPQTYQRRRKKEKRPDEKEITKLPP